MCRSLLSHRIDQAPASKSQADRGPPARPSYRAKPRWRLLWALIADFLVRGGTRRSLGTASRATRPSAPARHTWPTAGDIKRLQLCRTPVSRAYYPQFLAFTFFSASPSPRMHCLEGSPWRLGSDADLFLFAHLGCASSRRHPFAGSPAPYPTGTAAHRLG